MSKIYSTRGEFINSKNRENTVDKIHISSEAKKSWNGQTDKESYGADVQL